MVNSRTLQIVRDGFIAIVLSHIWAALLLLWGGKDAALALYLLPTAIAGTVALGWQGVFAAIVVAAIWFGCLGFAKLAVIRVLAMSVALWALPLALLMIGVARKAVIFGG